ncbi:lipase family protein [Microbulbifer sp. S227A]|uniref:lipase family protein n=1 Tax=Microbulbifer sp. S227A TaxID=3415131 RepID=UPI003C7A3412
MNRRAIILVPGFGRKQQGQERDKLASAIRNYADGWRVVPADEAPEGAVRLVATSRHDDVALSIDIREAYWGDLVPDWSEESPLRRFKRGSYLIWYWLTGGLRGWLARGQMPPRTSFAMIVAAIMLLCWYMIVILLVIKLIASGGVSLPEQLAGVEMIKACWDKLEGWAVSVVGSAVFVVALWLWSFGFLEKFANISAYTKAYLRDETFDGSETGLRAQVKQRALAALEIVHGDDHPAYDEIIVVGHSLGGAIALDALAEYGSRLNRIVLMTWGSALGSLAQQELLIERQIARLYDSQTPIHNWFDIVFRKDFMGSKAPIPRKFVDGRPTKELHPKIFPPTVEPVMPKGMSLTETIYIHDSYFRCEDAITRLLGPLDARPAT